MQWNTDQKNTKAHLVVKQENPVGEYSENAVIQHCGSQCHPKSEKGAVTMRGDNDSMPDDTTPIFYYKLLGMGKKQEKKHDIPRAGSGDTFNINTTYAYSPSVNHTRSQPIWLSLLLLLLVVTLLTQVVVLLCILSMSNAVMSTPTAATPLPQEQRKMAEMSLGLPEHHDFSSDKIFKELSEMAPTSTLLAPPYTQAAERKKSKDKHDTSLNPKQASEDGVKINVDVVDAEPHKKSNTTASVIQGAGARASIVDAEAHDESNTTSSSSQGASVRASISNMCDVKVRDSSHEGRKEASSGGMAGETSNGEIPSGEESKNGHAANLHKSSYPAEHSSLEAPNIGTLSQMTVIDHPQSRLLQNTTKIEQQTFQEDTTSTCQHSTLFHPQVGEHKGLLSAVVPTVVNLPVSHTPTLAIRGLAPQLNVPTYTSKPKFKCIQGAWDTYMACKSPEKTVAPQKPSPQSSQEVVVGMKVAFNETEQGMGEKTTSSINSDPMKEVYVFINTSSSELPELCPSSQPLSVDMQCPLEYDKFQVHVCDHPSCKSLCEQTTLTDSTTTSLYCHSNQCGLIPLLLLEHSSEQNLNNSFIFVRVPYQKQEYPLTAHQTLYFSTDSIMIRMQNAVKNSLLGLLFALILLRFHSCRRPTANTADSSSVENSTTKYPVLQENSPDSGHLLEQPKKSKGSQGMRQDNCPSTSSEKKTETESTGSNCKSGSNEAQTKEIWPMSIRESGDGDKKRSEVAGIQEYIVPPVAVVKNSARKENIKTLTAIEKYSQPTTFPEVHKGHGDVTVPTLDKNTTQWVPEENYRPELSELIHPDIFKLHTRNQLTLPLSGVELLYVQNEIFAEHVHDPG